MDEGELYKAIVRVVSNVPGDRIPEALAKVRALLSEESAKPEPPQQMTRSLRFGHDRKERGGKDRAE